MNSDMNTVSTVVLNPLQGDPRPAEDWVTTFHLALFVLDPFTKESGLIIPTAGRIMRNFRGADCRVAWLVAGTQDEAAQFLGPWAEEMLTFADPNREMIESLELKLLPAFVHLNHGLEISASAEGWNPAEWRDVAESLSQRMRWSRPVVPVPSDPAPFIGTPASLP